MRIPVPESPFGDGQDSPAHDDDCDMTPLPAPCNTPEPTVDRFGTSEIIVSLYDVQ